MGDFRIKVQADLDAKDLTAKLNALKKDIKIPVQLDIKNSELKALQSSIKELGKNVKLNVDASKGESAVKKISSEMKQMEKFKFKIETKGLESDLSKIQSQMSKFQTQAFTSAQKSQYSKIQESYKMLESMSKQMESKGSNLNSSDVVAYNKQLATTKNLVSSLSNELTGMASSAERIKFGNQMQTWINQNTKATKEARAEIEDYISRVKDTNSEMSKGDFNSVKNGYKSIVSEMAAAGKVGKSFTQELGRGFKQIAEFAYTYGAIQNVETMIMNSVGELKEVNSILTEISKTSNLTNTQLKQLGSDAFDQASVYGKKASDYLLGIQEMSRSGYYGKNAENMANLSVLAQAAGDLTADTANSYLLASNAAYNYQGNVEKLNAVLDGQNEITNKNSVSMEDMAAATTKAASMASEMGVAEDSLSAMIGTIEARTKASGEEVGTGIKSLLINLQNINNSKIVSTLDKAGISMTELKDGVEQMRDPISILEDLQKVFNSLDESDPLRSEILTNIGQKYHANQLSALLSGWDDYEKMVKEYSEGTGSAAEEAEKSANNWEGSINKLSNAFTSLVGNFANSDVIVTATNTLTGFVKVLDVLTQNPLVTAGIAGTGFGAFKFFKDLDELRNHRVSTMNFPILTYPIVGLADIRNIA